MAVVFFIDPALAQDPEQKHLDAITLSYSMYPVRRPVPPQADSSKQVAPGRS
jgi:cytochrome c oxidase assembly protein subunit 11